MSHPVVYSQAARQDIRKAFGWYEQRSLGMGSEFIRAVDAAAARLKERPDAFRLERGRYGRVRLRRFPYALHFVLQQDGAVTILACLHFRQSPQRWPGA